MKKSRLPIITLIIIFTLGFLASSLVLAAEENFAPMIEYAPANGLPDLSSGTAPSTTPAISRGSGLTFYTDRGTFDSLFPELPLEDFEEGNVPPDYLQGCPAPLDSTSNNVCFSAGDILPGVQFVDNPGPDPLDGLVLVGKEFNGGNNTKNVVTNSYIDSMDIFFDPGSVTVAGMDLTGYVSEAGTYLTNFRSNASMDQTNFLPSYTVTITVYGPDGGILGATTATTSNDGNFWGVSSDQYISRINIHTIIAAEGVDNLAFGSGSIVLNKTVGTDPNTCATTDSLILPVDVGGVNVTYCYRVMNTGNIALTAHNLVDDQLGAVFSGTFDLGLSDSFAVTKTANLISTTYNVATWTASFLDIGVWSTANARVTLLPVDSLKFVYLPLIRK